MVFYKILNSEAKKKSIYKMYTIIQCSLPVINIFVFPPSVGGWGGKSTETILCKDDEVM